MFIKHKLHFIFGPLSRPFRFLFYLSAVSKWINNIEKPAFNDFYAKRFDYKKRYDLYKHIIESEGLDEICYLEFGVSQGHSFRWWVSNIKNKNSRFAGFDTFSGLPEKWGVFQKGAMTADGQLPKIDDDRHEFVQGLFQNTLPDFLKRYDSHLRQVVHLDADIYSSTLFVLTALAPYLKKDDILIFDEFTVPLHEFKAFTDFVNSYAIKTKVIGAVNNYFQIAFKIDLNPWT